MKKIALITHEFGLMRNRGGIASYLYSYAKALLSEYPELQVHVVTCHLHEKCDLLSDERFFSYTLKSTVLSLLGIEVLELLKSIQPQYVETTDYLGLALEALVYKEMIGKELNHTMFMLCTHTASREIYEWGKSGELGNAPRRIKVPIGREWAQMVLADIVISPSIFLCDYVRKHYRIKRPRHVPPIFDYIKYDKSDLKKEMDELYDLRELKGKFVISYISRFEKRKNQQMLVNVFLRFVEEIAPDALLLLVGNSMADMETGRNLMLEVYETIPDIYKGNIRFFEFAVAEEKKKFFSVSDLAVMTSPYENFPFAMIEAVCCGVPIMTSIHCGCCDYMGSYKDLTSFEPFSEEDLFHKLVAFYKMEQEQRERIAAEQMRNLQNLCSYENSVYRKWELYLEMEGNVPQKKKPIVCVAYERDAYVEVENDCSLLFVHENGKIRNLEKLDRLLAKIDRHEGAFAISLGEDCLHTEISAAWEAGFPILFTHIEPVRERTDILMKRLMQERKQSYFSIPVEIFGNMD